MKIAYLSTFYPFRGGIAQFNANLYRALEEKNEIKAYTFKRQYPKLLFPGKSQYAAKEDRAEFIESVQILDTLNPFTFAKTAKVILRFKPDLLIMKYWMPYFAFPLGSVAKKLKKKGVITISILDNVLPHERRPGDILFTRYFFRQNNGFVVMSESVRKDLLKLKPDSKYILHPHPIYNQFGEKIKSSEARRKLGIPEHKKVILFFGYIRDYKGLDSLIESIRDLEDEYLVVVAGEAYGDITKYEKLIDKYSLQNKIRMFTRYIADSEVSTFFSCADVCILPYMTATQSGIMGIAYHFNIPLIVSNVGSLSQMVEKDETGIVLQKISPRAINSAIRKYFKDNLKARFQENIGKHKSRYTWGGLAESITGFYQKMKCEK